MCASSALVLLGSAQPNHSAPAATELCFCQRPHLQKARPKELAGFGSHSSAFYQHLPAACFLSLHHKYLIRCEPREAVNRWAKKTLEERYLKELYSSCDEPPGSSRLVECVSVVHLHNNTEPPPSWSSSSPFLNFRTVTSKNQSLPHRVSAAFGCFLPPITAVEQTC